MSELQFCYHCRVHHPESGMRRIMTRAGRRWRCIRSIEAARQSPGLRDEFGRLQTEVNRALTKRQAQYAHGIRFARDASSV